MLVTVHGAVRWQGESNANIRKAAALFPNVRVADWAEASDGHGEYFVSDGTHLTSDGLEAYAKPSWMHSSRLSPARRELPAGGAERQGRPTQEFDRPPRQCGLEPGSGVAGSG